MIPAVSTSPLEQATSLGAIVEMTLRLAGEGDRAVLLQGISQIARKIIPAQYASIAVLDNNRQTITGRICANGMDAPSAMPVISVLRPGLLTNMLIQRRALRVRDVTSESLGLGFVCGNDSLASVLSVPLSSSARVHGLLFLANRLGADEFNDHDEEAAVAIAHHVTLACERIEGRLPETNRSLEQRIEKLLVLNRELETFSYSVAHDLQGPISHVSCFARLLRERMGAHCDPESGRYMQLIEDASTHMRCLLKGVLDLAMLDREGLQVRLIDLNVLTSEVVEELKHDVSGRQIEWILDPLPAIQCDRILLKAVLSNLLSNAVKFTSLRQRATIQVSHRTNDREAVISVTDNGVGFNMKYAERLFEIFQRLHRPEDFPGIGIGLATAQRIIKKHDGKIWAEAEVNGGATFHFSLPLRDTALQFEN
jgi:signal transduction histidine kinase